MIDLGSLESFCIVSVTGAKQGCVTVDQISEILTEQPTTSQTKMIKYFS